MADFVDRIKNLTHLVISTCILYPQNAQDEMHFLVALRPLLSFFSSTQSNPQTNILNKCVRNF